MKKKLLAFGFCFGMFPVFSQITISNGDMPTAGDSVRVSIALGVGAVDHTLSGPNYLWDFSSLIPSAQQEYRYVSPTALPFNFLSTIAFLNPSPDSLPFVGNIPSNFTDYYKNGSSGFRRNGFSFDYTPLTSFSIPVIFSSSDYIYRFPLNYSDMDTSDASYTINFPPLPYIGQSIHRESNADGWGTLITPFGTFNCLREVSFVTTTDTVGLDSINGFSNVRPLTIEYKWLANGMKIPILEVDAQIILSAEVVTKVVYQDSLRSSLPQVGISESSPTISNIAVYPNPSNENCFVSYDLEKTSSVKIMLFDLSGRAILDFGREINLPGMHRKQLDFIGIESGIYLIKIESDGYSTTHPVVVGD